MQTKERHSLYWDGMLTTGNVEMVGEILAEILADRFHTVIAAHPMAYGRGDAYLSMDVHTSQKLYSEGGKPAIDARVADERAHITVHNSYGLWMVDSDLQGERAPYDAAYKNPYFKFSGNQATIWHRAPAGNLLVWTFASEDHTEY